MRTILRLLTCRLSLAMAAAAALITLLVIGLGRSSLGHGGISLAGLMYLLVLVPATLTYDFVSRFSGPLKSDAFMTFALFLNSALAALVGALVGGFAEVMEHRNHKKVRHVKHPPA